MNISQFKEAIKLAKTAHVPVFGWGPGGVGKTSGANQAADELGIDFLVAQATLLDPTDLMGMPDREGNQTIWLRPDFLPSNGDGILLIDELPDALPIVQKALYQLILDHKIKNHIIPESWFIMACGNRPEDSSFSSLPPAPLITRFVHIGVYCNTPSFESILPSQADVDINDFITYALANFHPYIGAYLKYKPEYIFNYQATPRTWEYISRLLYAQPAEDYNDYVFKELIKGAIGTMIGLEFIGFMNIVSKMPSLDLVIQNPESAPIPASNEHGILYALSSALVKHLNEKNEANILTYIIRLPIEFQVYFMVFARKQYKQLITNPKYLEWENANRNLLYY